MPQALSMTESDTKLFYRIDLLQRMSYIYASGDSGYPDIDHIFPEEFHLVMIKFSDRDEYWITPHNDPKNGVYDIHPYGILIKEL